MNFICSKCGISESIKTYKSKCACGGLWDLDFSPPRFSLDDIDHDEWSMFRYKKFLPLEDNSWQTISMGEGMTPIIHFDEDVLLKMDYFMPTLSFKDRGAAVLMAHCRSIGVTKVVQDSSGNAGNSIAAYSGKVGIDCEIFVPEGTSHKKIAMIASHGAKVSVVKGSRDDCADVCRAKVDDEGLYYANHVFNPFFYEGTKTYIYEVFEQLKRIPNYLLLPVGNGTLFLGAIYGLEELLNSGLISRMPQIIAVQSEGCDPLLQATEQNSVEPVEVSIKATMAEGIAIGKPMRGVEILRLARKYNVRFVHAPENNILAARAILAAKGVYCEHTTAANYAAYMHYCKLYGKISDCLITMCGAGLKSD